MIPDVSLAIDTDWKTMEQLYLTELKRLMDENVHLRITVKKLQAERVQNKVLALGGVAEQQAPLVKAEAKMGVLINEDAVRLQVRKVMSGLKQKKSVLDLQAQLLIKLYAKKDSGVAPQLLFDELGIGRKTGYRYISLFKEQNCVAFLGAKQNGRYYLTDKAIAIVENRL